MANYLKTVSPHSFYYTFNFIVVVWGGSHRSRTPGSKDLPASTSRVAGVVGMYHYTWLYVFQFEGQLSRDRIILGSNIFSFTYWKTLFHCFLHSLFLLRSWRGIWVLLLSRWDAVYFWKLLEYFLCIYGLEFHCSNLGVGFLILPFDSLNIVLRGWGYAQYLIYFYIFCLSDVITP